MRRMPVLSSVVAVVLLAVVSLSAQPHAFAQEATPAAEDEMMPEGLSFEALGYGTSESLPAAPAEFALIRIGLEPGAVLPLDAEDPTVGLVYVESGAVTFNVSAAMTVLHAAGEGTPFPTETEEMAASADFTVAAGDSFVFPANVGGELRNDGAEPASILVVNLSPPMMGETMDEGAGDQAATPAP